MIYFEKNKETNAVEIIHYQPFDAINGLGKTEAELLQTGVLIDTIPQPVATVGKMGVLYHTDAQGLYYVYIDVPKTPEQLQAERIAQLEADVATANYALMMGGLI
ncbi:hypothetical protein [Acetobacterium wieringae]|uniref:Uncharacterized protein n=1 Tax=Acetobacterium wieringae TaxID=52694 RepID=A0A1F2PMR6_9FIRM|nr:hypothetical protein [Acetobacterium wieringae]OFV72124.1 hypothetical protein ACWI_03740 [Acetobacterium wieringae]